MKLFEKQTFISGFVTFTIVVTEAILRFNYIKNIRARDLREDDNDANDPRFEYKFYMPEGDRIFHVGVIALFISVVSSLISKVLIDRFIRRRS